MQNSFAASACNKQRDPAIYLLFCNLINLIINLDAVSPIKASTIPVVHILNRKICHKYGRVVSGSCVR